MSSIRGVLLAGEFRTQHELNAMSHDDHRNTLITELAGRTNQSGAHFQGMDDARLAGAGAVLVFIRTGKIRSDDAIKTMSDDDLRNIMIVEMAGPTKLPVPVLQGMSNLDLVLLGLGKDASFIRGVLLAGKFRTQHELNAMSLSDHRNTLITELANRTNQPVAHFQGLGSDALLAGAGALLVFIRGAKIRSDDAIKTMSDDDLRNIMIVELVSQTQLPTPVLQGKSNLDLIVLGLGSVPAQTAHDAIVKKYNAINGRQVLGLALDDPHLEDTRFVQNFRSGNITISGEALNLPPTATITRNVKVFWKGLECRRRQEKEDEMYGTVASFTPSSGASKARSFPDNQEFFTMGHEGSRIINDAALICDSAVGDLLVVCSLVEHDSGDIGKYKEEVAKLLAKAAGGFLAMGGVDAETLAASEGFIGDVSLGLVNVAASVLGADDDQYNPGTMLIHAKELLQRFKPNPLDPPEQFPTQVLRRDDDPKTIEFTHSLILSGTDQGGDQGEYGLYFDVQLHSDIRVL